jgi:hypothetical protein
MLQDIFLGTAPGDKTGTPARQAGQMINANFAYLNGKIDRKDGIVATTGLTVSGQDVTMNAFWEWIIDTVNYTNPYAVVLNFPLATAGNSRLDMIALTTSNTAIRIAGAESTSNPVSPVLPENMLQAALVLITDSSVGTPSEPILGDAYVKKLERQKVIIPDDVLSFTLNDERHFVEFTNDEQGDFRYFILGANYVSGQNHPLRIRNNSGHAFTLMHLYPSGSNFPGEAVLFFPNNPDNFILQNKEIIEFVYDTDSNRFEYFGVNADISGKQDVLTETNFGAFESSLTAKATPIDADFISIVDTADSNKAKKTTFTQLKAFFKTYFDGFYGDMTTNTNQTVSGVKIFLNNFLGLRNVANTFTSFFTNSNTASRTYTLPDKNGIVAMTSDIVDKLNGTVNYLVKFGSTTTGVLSRILDTGTYLGIGTVRTPLKDITFGNQTDREIGIENSDSFNKGRDFRVKAGNTVDFLEDSLLLPMNILPVKPYIMMYTDRSANVYYGTYSRELAKRTNDSGNFINISGIPSSRPYSMCVAYNGDVYLGLGDFFEDVAIQTGGVGAFVRLNNGLRFTGMCALSNGDIYGVVGSSSYGGGTSGDIYKRTGGTGAFVSLGLPNQLWRGIASHTNNDVYACVANGDIYKQTGGVGSFVATGQVSRDWNGITIAPNGDVYTCVWLGDIYKQTGGIGAFVATGQVSRAYTGIAFSTNGYLYVCVENNDIYYINTNSLGLPNLDGGKLRLIPGVGKGTGESRLEFITGQKQPSGTDMQVETLRGYIDENGYFVLLAVPTYANDAAADADSNLPSGAYYKLTGNRTTFQKP